MGKRHFNCKFTEAEDVELAKIYQSGATIKRISEAYGNGIGRVAISNALSRQGIVSRDGAHGRGRFFDTDGDRLVAQMYKDGNSIFDLVYHFGLGGPNAIVNALNRQGVDRRPNRTHFFNENRFDDIACEGTHYWLGFIYADGYVTRNALRFGLAPKDKDQLERLREFMGGGAPVKDYRGHVETHWHHVHLGTRLQGLGIIPRRNSFELTERAIRPEHENHFIRGYCDGDGCISTNQQVVFEGQMDILTWIRDRLIRHADASPVPKFRPRPGIYEIGWGGRLQAKRVVRYLYRNATIFLKRKKNVADAWR